MSGDRPLLSKLPCECGAQLENGYLAARLSRLRNGGTIRQGAATGPDLSQEAKLGRLPQWLITQITDPIKHNPSSIMPAHKNLTQQQILGLAGFILNPSSRQGALNSGPESKPEEQPSASSANAVQVERSKSSASPSSSLPAADAQAVPLSVFKMIGAPRHDAILFELYCAKCHDKAGTDNVPNPGSQAGVVSALAPIAPGLFSADTVEFAANIDRFIQQGLTPLAPALTLQIPAFGTTHPLAVQEIANIEAYVLSLNGVDAAKIIRPGITPLRLVEGTMALFALALLPIAGLWVYSRTSSFTQTRGRPTSEELQALKHEVADLKQKLEEMETRNRKE